MPELHGKLYLIQGVPDDLDVHLVKILGEMVGKIVLIIFLTCSLMQDSKKGARGVSTRTALYSSAGVLGKRGIFIRLSMCDIPNQPGDVYGLHLLKAAQRMALANLDKEALTPDSGGQLNSPAPRSASGEGCL